MNEVTRNLLWAVLFSVGLGSSFACTFLKPDIGFGYWLINAAALPVNLLGTAIYYKRFYDAYWRDEGG